MPPSPPPEELLAAILSLDTEAMCVFAVDGTVLAWGAAAERLYGYSEAEIVGRPMTVIVPPQKAADPEQLCAKCTDGMTTAETRERLHKKGFLLRVNVMRSVVRDGTGKPIAIVERAHALNGESTIGNDLGLRAVLEQVPALIWTTDRNLRITSNWGTVTPLTGVKAGELIGRTVYDFIRDEKDGRPATGAQPTRFIHGSSSSIEIRRRDRDYEIRLEPLRDAAGGITGYIAAGFDITDRKRSEEKIRYQATHDALTGLANYREFLDSLEREIRRSERAVRPFGVLLLDMDDLKRINDRWGHLAGNRALRRLAEVLKRQCRSTDLSARYGGDEFAVLMIDADTAMARQVARRIESGLERDREEPQLRVSIGISMYPDDGRSSTELLEAADKQLYRNKRPSHAQMISVR